VINMELKFFDIALRHKSQTAGSGFLFVNGSEFWPSLRSKC